MRKLLNILLVFTLIAALGTGVIVYLEYNKAKKNDVERIQENTELYEDLLKKKQGRADDVLLNVIYYTDEVTGELKDVYLEIFNCQLAKLAFLRLPLQTRISIDMPLYQKLCGLNAKMPQYFSLEILDQLFSKKDWPVYGQIILDQQLVIDSSCYTVIYGTEATFEEFVKNTNVQLLSEDSIRETMSSILSSAKSNLKENKQLEYVSSYAKLTEGDIRFYTAKGEQLTEEYRLASTELATQIATLSRGEHDIFQ